MNIPDGIAFKTTSLCQAYCNDCSVMEWMNHYHNWHASIEDVDRFVYYTKKSNYRFGIINLTGGEPLLWNNLLEGTRMLREGDITGNLVMYTNALGLNEGNKDKIGEVIDYLHSVRISLYSGNEEQAEYFKECFPKKVQIKSQKLRPIPPTERIEGTRPASCFCGGYCLDQGEIDICAPARSIIIRMGWDLKDFDYISVPLKENYLDGFKNVERENQLLCEYCIGNMWVHNVIPKVTCEIKEKKLYNRRGLEYAETESIN